MKRMKKYLKVALSFLAFALCSFMFAFAPTISAISALSLSYEINKLNTEGGYSQEINSINMPSVIDAKVSAFTIPLLKVKATGLVDSAATKYTVRVIDLAGRSHDYVVNGTEEENKDVLDVYFSYDAVNKKLTYLPIQNTQDEQSYKVVYIVNNGEDKLYSDIYEVKVKNVLDFELDFTSSVAGEEGKNNLIPSLAKKGDVIELPVAKAVSETGSLDVLPVVRKNNVLLTVAEDNDDFAKVGNKYVLTLKDTSNYSVEYSWGQNLHKTFDIKVTNNDVDKSLKVVTNPGFESMQLGQTGVKINKPEFKNSNEENKLITSDNYNVKITITHASKPAIKQVLDYNTWEFDFTKEAFGATSYDDMIGYYNFSYEVTDNNGATTTFENRTASTITVDKATPKAYLSYDYEVNTNGTLKTDVEDINLDASQELKVKYGYDEIEVPALYGYDQVSNYEDLILVRYLVNANNTDKKYAIDNYYYNEDTDTYTAFTKQDAIDGKVPVGFNDSGDANIGNPNKSVKFKFTNTDNIEGTYYLEYRVVSKNIKIRETKFGKDDYKIQIDAQSTVDYSSYVAPKVEIKNINDNYYVVAGQELRVEMTATDEKDTNYRNAVFFFTAGYTTDDKFTTDLGKAITEIQTADKTQDVFKNVTLLKTKMETAGYENFTVLTLEDGKYTTTLPTELTGTPTIAAVSVNDAGRIGVKVKTQEVKSVTEKNEAKFKITSAGELIAQGTSNINPDAKFVQYDTITLPEVEFVDAEDQCMNISVYYYIESPETDSGLEMLTPSNIEWDGNKVLGGEIKADRVGKYFVGYSAMDAAGNTTVTFFKFEVEGQITSNINFTVNGEDVAVSGNEYTIDKGQTLSFTGKVIKSDESEHDQVKITVKNADGLAVERTGNVNTYKFNSVGTYTVTFTDKNAEATSKTIFVTVTEPTLRWLSDFNVQKYAGMGETVYLPYMAANHGAHVDVTVKGPSNSTLPSDNKVKATTIDGKQVWAFKTYSSESIYATGTYTVTYTATAGDEKLTQTFNIKVGDSVGPTLTMTKQAELKQDVVYDGEHDIEYYVTLDKANKTIKIKAVSNGETLFTYDDIELSITDRDGKNELIEGYKWNYLSFDLTKDGVSATKGDTDEANTTKFLIKDHGKYTLNITSTDSLGNAAIEDINIEFKVVRPDSQKSDNGTIIGAVLIVVSLLVLAGVILFFTFTGKNKKGSKSKKKDNKQEVVETSTEDNVVVEENKDNE